MTIAKATAYRFPRFPSYSHMHSPEGDRAADALTDGLLTMTDHFTAPPCAQDKGRLWLSEDPKERAEACRRCAGCPVMAECEQYAQTARPPITHGVFAGLDLTVERRTRAAS